MFLGRVVNAPGNSIRAGFGGVGDGVACAAGIQRELAEGNAERLEDRKLLFRIGANLGDVMVGEKNSMAMGTTSPPGGKVEPSPETARTGVMERMKQWRNC